MLQKEAFWAWCAQRPRLLDGATGTALRQAGMPLNCCAEAWILAHPQLLLALQADYAAAGSELIYAPTFQANRLALDRYGLDRQVKAINAQLVALSRRAAPQCRIAGDVTTLAGSLDINDVGSREKITAVYREQIAALCEAGVDVIMAETLLSPLEAEAVLAAAALEGADTVIVSFTGRSDGTLFSGGSLAQAIQRAAADGAAAVGLNCIPASPALIPLCVRLAGELSAPFLCKPSLNALQPEDSEAAEADFVKTATAAVRAGVRLIGGCCGTAPAQIRRLRQELNQINPR